MGRKVIVGWEGWLLGAKLNEAATLPRGCIWILSSVDTGELWKAGIKEIKEGSCFCFNGDL